MNDAAPGPETVTAPQPSAAKTHEQSTIQFPYGDLNDAVSVAHGVMSCGGVPVDGDQLAGAMKQTPTSGAFRTKIATARIFGVIETVQGKYQLTDLGFAIADKDRERAARADAFLKVPLYKKLYDEFRNRQLPPRPAALEHAMVGFGVAQKQKDRARQAFDRSAQQAGYFDQGGRDRLIRPPVGSASGVVEPNDNSGAGRVDPPPADVPPGGNLNNGGGGGGGRHPFIDGLLKTLPATGTVWSVEGRAAWLEAAASVFKLLYQGDGKIKVTAEEKE